MRKRIKNVKLTYSYFHDKQWNSCSNCGLIMSISQFSEKTLNNFYKKTYWDKINVSINLYNLSFENHNVGNLRTLEQFKFIRKFLKKNVKHFVDFGAGKCDAALYKKKNCFSKNITVFDKSEYSCLIAKKFGLKYVDKLNLLN